MHACHQQYGKPMCEVIERCWIGEPALRLSAEEVVDILENMKATDDKAAASKGDKQCTVM
jgi:hypothetical protein